MEIDLVDWFKLYGNGGLKVERALASVNLFVYDQPYNWQSDRNTMGCLVLETVNWWRDGMEVRLVEDVGVSFLQKGELALRQLLFLKCFLSDFRYVISFELQNNFVR